MTQPRPDRAHIRRPTVMLGQRPEPPRGGFDLAWRLGIPAGGVLAGLAFIQFGLPPALSRALFAFATVYVMPFGMDVAVPGAVVIGLKPWHLVALVCYFDIWFTLFWIWNLDHLMRFALIRRFVDRCIARANSVFARRPWLARLTVPGLAFFIFLPLVGTGSITGIILGKLIGMPAGHLYVASTTGTASRVLLLAYGTQGLVMLFRFFVD